MMETTGNGGAEQSATLVSANTVYYCRTMSKIDGFHEVSGIAFHSSISHRRYNDAEF